MCKPPYKFVLPSSDSLFQTIFRDICSQRPSRRNSASCGQRNRIMGVSPALLALIGKYHYPHTFHRLFGKLFRILKRHIYRSSFRSLGVWFLWLPRFHTGRVINVLAELIFYCQVTWSFYSPYTCIGVEVWYLTTVFYCDFKSLLSLHKILCFFLLMFC